MSSYLCFKQSNNTFLSHSRLSLFLLPSCGHRHVTYYLLVLSVALCSTRTLLALRNLLFYFTRHTLHILLRFSKAERLTIGQVIEFSW